MNNNPSGFIDINTTRNTLKGHKKGIGILDNPGVLV